MRPVLWLLAPILFAGCSKGGTDGVYMMTLVLTDDKCSDDPTLGGSEQVLMSLFHTSEGTVVVELNGALLPGVIDKDGLHINIEQGTRYSDAECETYQEISKGTMNGTWTKDQGLTGTLRSVQELVIEGCDAYGQDTNDSCEVTYAYTAVKMVGSAEDYPADDWLWASPPGFDGGY